MILYRYRNVNRAIELLKNLEVYFPRPRELNDPFDCRIGYILQASHNESTRKIVNYILGKNTGVIDFTIGAIEAQKTFKDGLMKLNDEFGILSLSEIKNSILMWSHYSDCHKGVVFGLDVPDQVAKKVEYIDELPKQTEVARALGNEEQLTRLFLLRKSTAWSYERERRWIIHIPSNANSQNVKFAPGAISEVIFGCEISEKNKTEIINLLEKSEAAPALFQARKHDSRYEVEILKM